MPLLTGCAYYPEQWPSDRWANDARLMREAGISVVRLAEFAWDKLEPKPGTYDFDWLEQAVETLANAGIKIVLCTPTATPPPWLTYEHPEICRVEQNGVRVSTGARRSACANVPAYRAKSRQIVEQIAQRFGQHPAVIGWQIDNEFGCGESTRCHCDSCRQRFHEWLADKYTSLDVLNQAWGTQFWGMTYPSWDPIPIPGITTEPQSPSMRLDYRRFSSDSWKGFQQMQIGILHSYSPDRWITHNFMIRHWSLDYWRLAEDLDFVSYDNYPHGVDDPAEVSMNLDLMRSFKRRPFWVMEQQPGRVNWHPYSPPVPDGQVRVWSHQAVAHGAESIVYFSFQPARSGQEQYHTGFLKWDGSPDQTFVEAQQVAEDFVALPTLKRQAASVGILFDYDDLWAIELEPHNRDFSYWELVKEIYRAYWQANIPVDFVPRGVDPAGYETLIVPAAILIHPGEGEKWHAWVEKGGRLIITFRSGVRELSNTAHLGLMPGGLLDLVGAQVKRFCSVPPATYTDWPEHRPGTQIQSMTGKQSYRYKLWAESLEPTTAQPIFTYTDGLLAGEIAATQNTIGAGRVFYIGCWVEDFAQFAHAQGWLPPIETALQQTLLQGEGDSRWLLTLNHSGHAVEDLSGFGVRYEEVESDDGT